MTLEAIESAKETAASYHHLEPNCNCAQSVACTLCDKAGITKDQAFRAMEGFGGGMGGFTETCGAISGAIYLISNATSIGFENRTTKDITYEKCANLVKEFNKEFDSTLCTNLRSDNLEERKAICDGYIRFATELAAKSLG